jgi:hypothetical protein
VYLMVVTLQGFGAGYAFLGGEVGTHMIIDLWD